MNNIKTIHIFIGSPSDTKNERICVTDIIDELNHTLGKDRNIKIEKIMWEYDVDPTIGDDGQDVINQQTRDYDIFLGMMWRKFGTPTLRASSGTEEEYSRAVKSVKGNGHCKDIIMLFNIAPVPIDTDAEQLKYVQLFKQKVIADGVFYKDYCGTKDFSSVARVALYNRIVALLKKEPQSSNAVQKQKTSIPSVTPIDENTKLVFDTLTNSPAVNDMKSKFIESYILLFLFDKGWARATDILSYLSSKLGHDKTNLYNGVLGKLNNTDCLTSDDSSPKRFGLSENMRKKISSIKQEVSNSSVLLLDKCQEICYKYDLPCAHESLNAYICKLFEIGFSQEIGEWSRTALIKDCTLKGVYGSLTMFLSEETGLPEGYVTPIANELIETYSKNPIVYKANTSRMFLSLFKNDKLNDYLTENTRELLLDTQVLLRICCVTFDGIEPIGADLLYKIGKRFWDIVKNNPNILLFTTTNYIEEVVGHLKSALKLSRFLELDYIKDLGPSKNVFFNHYLTIRDEADMNSFEEYINQFLDEDVSMLSDEEFDNMAFNHLFDIFENLSITIISTPEIEDYHNYKKTYETTLAFLGYPNRSYMARKNDIHTTLCCGNLFSNFKSTPFLITTDTTFVEIRNKMVEKHPNINYWYVYTPQKISETLSLMNFKVEPNMIDDNIISLTESNFNTSNESISFIDLLNTFIDAKTLSEWKLASKLSKLRKLQIGPVSDNSIVVQNLPIDEFLQQLMDYYSSKTEGYKFSDLKDLFCNNDVADTIAEYIQNQIEIFKSGKTKLSDQTIIFFDDLIRKSIKQKNEYLE